MKSTFFILVFLVALGTVNAQDNALEQLTNQYFRLYTALKNGQTDVVQREASLIKAGLFLPAEFEGETMQQYSFVLPEMLKQAAIIASSPHLEMQKKAFNELSIALWKVLKVEASNQNDYYYLYCPMKKAYWISTDNISDNPYFGHEMRTCSTVNESR